MKKLLSLTATTLFALAAIALASPDKDALIQSEKAVWQTIKDKDFDAFQKSLAPDFRGVYSDGINKMDKEVSDVRKLDFKSYSIGDVDVVFITKDVALLTYTVTVEGTSDGKDISGNLNAASAWKKEGNDWRVSYHTDVKAE
jgi:hypothetical protein